MLTCIYFIALSILFLCLKVIDRIFFWLFDRILVWCMGKFHMESQLKCSEKVLLICMCVCVFVDFEYDIRFQCIALINGRTYFSIKYRHIVIGSSWLPFTWKHDVIVEIRYSTEWLFCGGIVFGHPSENQQRTKK